MKRYLGEVLNKKKRPVKVNGRILSNPRRLEYIVLTNSGKMKVDATRKFEVGKRVVIYDGLIHDYAGSEPATVSAEV